MHPMRKVILEFKRGHTLFAFKFVVGIIEFRGAKVINASSFREMFAQWGWTHYFRVICVFVTLINLSNSMKVQAKSSIYLLLSSLEMNLCDKSKYSKYYLLFRTLLQYLRSRFLWTCIIWKLQEAKFKSWKMTNKQILVNVCPGREGGCCHVANSHFVPHLFDRVEKEQASTADILWKSSWLLNSSDTGRKLKC